ncbi:MAG: hypothetical protein HY913_08990 [Desulfomonile tiedjei]|nr:hypothetical protein [Desulfomonile tiedjei]
MKRPNLMFAAIMASLLLVFSGVTVMSGTQTTPADSKQIEWSGKVSGMVCTPQPERTGDGFKLACYVPVPDFRGSNGPARNNSDILRDLYRERNETPFWKN